MSYQRNRPARNHKQQTDKRNEHGTVCQCPHCGHKHISHQKQSDRKVVEDFKNLFQK